MRSDKTPDLVRDPYGSIFPFLFSSRQGAAKLKAKKRKSLADLGSLYGDLSGADSDSDEDLLVCVCVRMCQPALALVCARNVCAKRCWEASSFQRLCALLESSSMFCVLMTCYGGQRTEFPFDHAMLSCSRIASARPSR